MSEEQDRGDIDAIAQMSLGELRDAWRTRFKSNPPAYQSRLLLLHAFAYRLQARRCGGLSATTRRRLRENAEKFATDPRYAPTPTAALQPGTVLLRDWNGRRYGVTVTETGFLFEGATYPSLSTVAHAITGTKRSGPLFFRTRSRESATP